MFGNSKKPDITVNPGIGQILQTYVVELYDLTIKNAARPTSAFIYTKKTLNYPLNMIESYANYEFIYLFINDNWSFFSSPSTYNWYFKYNHINNTISKNLVLKCANSTSSTQLNLTKNFNSNKITLKMSFLLGKRR